MGFAYISMDTSTSTLRQISANSISIILPTLQLFKNHLNSIQKSNKINKIYSTSKYS